MNKRFSIALLLILCMVPLSTFAVGKKRPAKPRSAAKAPRAARAAASDAGAKEAAASAEKAPELNPWVTDRAKQIATQAGIGPNLPVYADTQKAAEGVAAILKEARSNGTVPSALNTRVKLVLGYDARDGYEPGSEARLRQMLQEEMAKPGQRTVFIVGPVGGIGEIVADEVKKVTTMEPDVDATVIGVISQADLASGTKAPQNLRAVIAASAPPSGLSPVTDLLLEVGKMFPGTRCSLVLAEGPTEALDSAIEFQGAVAQSLTQGLQTPPEGNLSIEVMRRLYPKNPKQYARAGTSLIALGNDNVPALDRVHTGRNFPIYEKFPYPGGPQSVSPEEKAAHPTETALLYRKAGEKWTGDPYIKLAEIAEGGGDQAAVANEVMRAPEVAEKTLARLQELAEQRVSGDRAVEATAHTGILKRIVEATAKVSGMSLDYLGMEALEPVRITAGDAASNVIPDLAANAAKETMAAAERAGKHLDITETELAKAFEKEMQQQVAEHPGAKEVLVKLPSPISDAFAYELVLAQRSVAEIEETRKSLANTMDDLERVRAEVRGEAVRQDVERAGEK